MDRAVLSEGEDLGNERWRVELRNKVWGRHSRLGTSALYHESEAGRVDCSTRMAVHIFERDGSSDKPRPAERCQRDIGTRATRDPAYHRRETGAPYSRAAGDSVRGQEGVGLRSAGR